MSDAAGALDRLVEALSHGEREAALACFAPDASIVLSGAHHDYASYPPERVVDGLLRAFMEVSWTPLARRVVGGANVDEGVLAATHIGPFLGVDPSAEQVRATVRLSYTVLEDRLEMLSVWGDRETVVEQLSGVAESAGDTPAELDGRRLRAPSRLGRRRSPGRGVVWGFWMLLLGSAQPGRGAAERP